MAKTKPKRVQKAAPSAMTPAEMGRRSRAMMTKRERSDAARVAATMRWARVRALR